MYFAPFYGYCLNTKQSLVLFIILDILLIPISIAIDIMAYTFIADLFIGYESIEFILCDVIFIALGLGFNAVTVLSIVETIKTLKDLVNEKRKDLKNEKVESEKEFSRTKYINDYVKSFYGSIE